MRSRSQICLLILSLALFLLYFNYNRSVSSDFYVSEVFDMETKFDMAKVERNCSVFVLETDDGAKVIKDHLLCALEAVATANPDLQIHLLLSSDSSVNKAPHYLRNFPNLHLSKTIFDDLVEDSVLEGLWHSAKLRKSSFFVNNKSNLLRLILLYRLGGFYLDSDALALRPMPRSPTDFMVAESRVHVNNALMHFTEGHPFVHLAMSEMAESFKGDHWGFQGPLLVTRTFKKYCNLSSDEKLVVEEASCNNEHRPVTVLNRKKAYPIQWEEWRNFYNGTFSHLLNVTNQSIVVHFWHSLRNHYLPDLLVKESDPLYQLFHRVCPQTVKHEIRHKLGLKYS